MVSLLLNFTGYDQWRNSAKAICGKTRGGQTQQCIFDVFSTKPVVNLMSMKIWGVERHQRGLNPQPPTNRTRLVCSSDVNPFCFQNRSSNYENRFKTVLRSDVIA